MLTVVCPTCGWELRAQDQYAGKCARCPHCGTICHLPGTPLPTATSADLPPWCSICGHGIADDEARVKDIAGEHYHPHCYDELCRRIHEGYRPTQPATPIPAPPAPTLPPVQPAPEEMPAPADDVCGEAAPVPTAADSSPESDPPLLSRHSPLGLLIGAGVAVPVLMLLLMAVLALWPSSWRRHVANSDALPAVEVDSQADDLWKAIEPNKVPRENHHERWTIPIPWATEETGNTPRFSRVSSEKGIDQFTGLLVYWAVLVICVAVFFHSHRNIALKKAVLKGFCWVPGVSILGSLVWMGAPREVLLWTIPVLLLATLHGLLNMRVCPGCTRVVLPRYWVRYCSRCGASLDRVV